MLEESSATRTVSCAICHEPVTLETAKTDERGMAVHEDCYWANLKTRRCCANGSRAATRAVIPRTS